MVWMISSLYEVRRLFITALVGASAVASPAKWAVAYTIDRMEGAVAAGAAQ